VKKVLVQKAESRREKVQGSRREIKKKTPRK